MFGWAQPCQHGGMRWQRCARTGGLRGQRVGAGLHQFDQVRHGSKFDRIGAQSVNAEDDHTLEWQAVVSV